MKRPCALLFLLALAAPGFPQSNYAVLTGAATDPQHLPVAGAAVELTAASTGATRRGVTNQQRPLDGPALLPHCYELKRGSCRLSTQQHSRPLEGRPEL